LILEADQESHRLLTLLGDSGPTGDESELLRQPDVVNPDKSSVIAERSGELNGATVAQPLSAEQQEMVGQLKGGGYTLEQIARLLRRSPNEILSVLRQADDSAGKDQTDAA
jgi:DNA-directed RNA polymerase specialized sigma24 family protein